MATSYLEEDDHIAEDGVTSRLARALTKAGRFFAGVLTTLGAFSTGAAGWFFGAGWEGGWFKPETWHWGITGFGIAAAVLGIGHAAKAIDSFKTGQRTRGVKELLRGAAEVGYVMALPTLLAGMPFVLALAAEPLVVSLTGKSITANIGELAGGLLDGATDQVKHRETEQLRRRPQSAMAMQPQQPVIQPQMFGGVPQYVMPGSLSAVPAAVPMQYVSPPVAQQMMPQGGWAQRITAQRNAAIEAQQLMQQQMTAQAQAAPIQVVAVPQRPRPAIPQGYAVAVADGSLAASQQPMRQGG